MDLNYLKLKKQLEDMKHTDYGVYVVEDEEGRKVSTKQELPIIPTRDQIFSNSKIASNILASNIAPIKNTISTDIDQLRARKSELQKQLSSYNREEKTKWWDQDNNILENIGNVLYKTFAEKQDTKYKDDEKFNQLKSEYENVSKQLEDAFVANKQYKGAEGTLEKITDTITGNAMTSIKGIESTAKKILLQKPTEEDTRLTLDEKLAQKARQETSGAGGVGLDILGSVTRMLPQMMIGNSAGATAMGFANYGGGAYNQARQEGATEEQATAFGAITGSLEMMLNKILPSFNLGGKNVYGKTLTDNIMKKVVTDSAFKNFVFRTINGAAGEFTEEYLQEFLEPIIRNTVLEQDNGADFWNTMKDDVGEGLKQLGSQFFNKENLYAGALGAATSGIMGFQSNVDSYRYEKRTGRNAETGLTANEQSIFDKEVENRVQEAEKEGKKLSKKEKAKIEEQVKNDLWKGYISTDTIESTLGGEEYNSYKSILDKQNRYNELLDKNSGETTNREKLELEALTKELDKADINTLRSNLDAKLMENIKNDDYLQRSYQEKANRGVSYQADITKYDAKQQETIKKAIDSGILNNTNKTHDFVDMIAKLSADKGVSFDFTNNTKLKDSGFAVEGKQVNGFVNENGITINIDSKNALNSVVGHEITHVLEGTELYTELQQAVKEYATTKGVYDTKLAELTEMYKNVEGANVENELTSDLVGEYLFTDADFVKNLSTTKPSVFQKIYNEIKYMLKVATAGSKEARQLEKVKKTFEEAYKSSGNNLTNDTKYLLTYVEKANLNKDQQLRLDAAVKLNDSGMTAEEIWRKTGVLFDINDNKTKMYIPDAKFKENAGDLLKIDKSVKLSDVLEGRIFETNPELKDYYVKVTNLEKLAASEGEENTSKYNKIKGATTYDKGILLNDNIKTLAEAENVLAHEMQHLIQEINGNEESTSNLSLKDYRLDPTEIEAEVNRVLNSMTESQRKNIDPKSIENEIRKYYEENNYKVLDVDKVINKLVNKHGIQYSISDKGTLQDSNGNDIKLETSDAGTHGTLMAIHNLSEAKLKGILELGGFPEPSIAVMNPSTTSLEYGNISVLFDKNTIDPSNKANEVYGSDVYSPRFPQTIQKVNEKELSKLENYLGKNLYLEDTTLDETVQKNRYTKEFIDKFAKENNITAENVYKDSGFNYTFSTDENVRNFITENDITFEKLLNDKQLRNEFYDLYRQSSQGILKGLTERKIETFEKAFADNNTNIGSRLDSDFNSIKNGSEKVLDEYATEKALRDKVLNEYEDQYTKFLTEKLTPVFEDKYIRNSKELFTPAGNRRSFNQLYNEYTLDNVVKEMKGKVRGEEGFFYGSGNIRSQVTPQFKSIADIKANENKLVTNSQMESVKADIDSDLNNLSVTAKNFGGYTYDSYETALNEIAGLKKITPDKAKNILNDYGFENVPDILIDKSIEFLEKLKNAPTEYFEAKPQRAVGLDEVQAIIIPNNIDTDLKQQLLDKGLNIVEYDPYIEGDKQSKINQFDDLKFSLSNQNEISPRNPNLTYGEDVRLQEQIAPIYEPSQEGTTVDDIDLYNKSNFDNLDFQNIPKPQDFSPDYMYENDNEGSKAKVETPFDDVDMKELGKKNVKAYQYEHPEFREYFQPAAVTMLGDLERSIKGQRMIIGDISQTGDGNYQYTGTTRQTTEDIAYLLDNFNYTYADIEKGLKAIIEDNGEENIAIAKRLEPILNDRLAKGYTDVDGYEIPANQEYINFLEAKNLTDYYNSIPVGEAPLENVENSVENASNTSENKKIAFNEAVKNSMEEVEKKLGYSPKDPTKESTYDEIAKVLTEEPKTPDTRNKRKWAIFKASVLDKGTVFEDISLKAKNRELMGKWDYTLTSQSRAQNVIGNGHTEFDPDTKAYKQTSKSLNDIRAEVENTGMTQDFYNYMYHKHNVDRMNLEGRFEDVVNKPVFGNDITSEISQQIVNEYENVHPEFMDFAKDVYDYVNADRQQLVSEGIISQETADLWAKMYPHYVPIRRVDSNKNAIDVPLDTRRTGINAPIKKATGGSADILPLFDTMAMRTLQTYRATAKNSFGVELMNTLNTNTEIETTNVDSIIDSIDNQEGLLQEGKNGKNPTFTVFQNGEKVTYDITQDMYDALKPISDSSLLSKTVKPLNAISNFQRGVLTQYNLFFALTNAVKDAQDVLINSQHAAKTYATVPEAWAQLASKGYWYQEYMANGGEQNSYFDSHDNTFNPEKKGLSKITETLPLRAISSINDVIEMTPRLAEYIASRKAGRSVEVAMLDAARVTTNFKAGGDFTKFLNRNGATFLNASVQGFNQQVRNIREANANGIKGWATLATKFAVAGLPALLLNGLLWGDDDDYEELSDYVKQNYYIVAKYGDGQFIRIPKGRTLAVIQNAMEQVQKVSNGDDEADLQEFISLFLNNLAPNNPIENNVLSPIIQAATNKAWYGDDLVPTRLQDLPVAEQYDESTDSFSKWLGEKLNVSPYKINYVLDQYTGFLGDMFLPMATPEAKNSSESVGDYLIAPLKDKFTTDSVMNNKNTGELFETSEKLTTESKKSNATDEDKLKNKFINSMKSEMNELYKQKREIQNSDLSKSEKYNQVREVQKEINALAKSALNNYEDVKVNENYASVSDIEYYKHLDSEGKEVWTKINSKEKEALNSMNMSDNDKNNYFTAKNTISGIVKEYKNNKATLDDDDEDSYKEAASSLSGEKKATIINTIKNSGLNDEQKAYLYDKYYASTDKLNVVVQTGISMDSYLDLEAQNFQSDKNNKGETISGSKKRKVFDYINSTNLDFEQKVILAKMYYPSYDEYNYDIINYLNDNEYIDFDSEVKILKTLGFKVSDDGTITWK